MTETRPYHHGDLRAALLRAAGEVLERDGADAVTLRGLARELGVSHAAPGHHFVDRDALLLELAAEGHEMLAAAMQARLAQSTGNRLEAIGKGYLDFALGHPQRFRLMFSGIAGLDWASCPALSAAGARSLGILLDVTTSSDSPGEDTATWLHSWALVHGLATLWNDGALAGSDSLHGNDFRTIADEIVTRNADEAPTSRLGPHL